MMQDQGIGQDFSPNIDMGKKSRSSSKPPRPTSKPGMMVHVAAPTYHHPIKSSRGYNMLCGSCALAVPLILFLLFMSVDTYFGSGINADEYISGATEKMLTKDEHVTILATPARAPQAGAHRGDETKDLVYDANELAPDSGANLTTHGTHDDEFDGNEDHAGDKAEEDEDHAGDKADEDEDHTGDKADGDEDHTSAHEEGHEEGHHLDEHNFSPILASPKAEEAEVVSSDAAEAVALESDGMAPKGEEKTAEGEAGRAGSESSRASEVDGVGGG
eukprot:CAMPEP_0198202032 /NCGR_PEP_ID=MMETSP1445-20131203/5088_1 /TAXON_ID=36898 /ORGANISM="Pyramimonas sp., Strain CCMP2087" /LENGTH=273 /DNA_ID=CAMNT_0043872737 /DNA_START=108 /DNA_END=925 /DNA_ORIENTATION=-